MNEQNADTPRTKDAIHRFWNGGLWSERFADFARTLERELNEARELISNQASLLQWTRDEHVAAMQERNQLRSELEKLHGQRSCEFMDVEAAIGKGRLLGGWKTVCDEITQLRTRVAELEAQLEGRDQQIDSAINILDGNEEPPKWRDVGCPELLCKLAEHLEAWDADQQTIDELEAQLEAETAKERCVSPPCRRSDYAENQTAPAAQSVP